MQVAEIIGSMLGSDVPVRVLGYDGSKAGPGHGRDGGADRLPARARAAGDGAGLARASPGRT